jgi:hypothetical protein
MLIPIIIRVAAAFALVAVITSTTANAAITYPIDVPFLQAAIFFMTGKEPPSDVKFDSDKKAIVKDTVLVPNKGAMSATWEIAMRDDKPCILYAALLSPEEAFNTINFMTGEGNGGRRLEFNKLPSPRAFSHNSSGYVSFDLPHETWCSYRTVRENGEVKLLKGSTTCSTGISFQLNERWYRRIAALDYIRANYCKGQPEPAPQPRMPY